MSANAVHSRRIVSAIVAVALTVAIHGGWLAGMDRDAAAVAAEVRA
jgi:hypothetical protein